MSRSPSPSAFPAAARLLALGVLVGAAGISSRASAGDPEPAPMSPTPPVSAPSTPVPAKPARPPIDLAAPTGANATKTATFVLG